MVVLINYNKYHKSKSHKYKIEKITNKKQIINSISVTKFNPSLKNHN